MKSLASRYDMEMIRARAKSSTSDPEAPRSKRDYPAGHSASPTLAGAQKKVGGGLKTDR